MFCLPPCGDPHRLTFLASVHVQASALMAENAVAPMLVIETLKAHVSNFQAELDQ